MSDYYDPVNNSNGAGDVDEPDDPRCVDCNAYLDAGYFGDRDDEPAWPSCGPICYSCLANCYERLTADVERLALTWSKERPTVAGLYMTRVNNDEDSAELCFYTKEDLIDDVHFPEWAQHAGPITVQEPATQKEVNP